MSTLAPVDHEQDQPPAGGAAPAPAPGAKEDITQGATNDEESDSDRDTESEDGAALSRPQTPTPPTPAKLPFPPLTKSHILNCAFAAWYSRYVPHPPLHPVLPPISMPSID